MRRSLPRRLEDLPEGHRKEALRQLDRRREALSGADGGTVQGAQPAVPQVAGCKRTSSHPEAAGERPVRPTFEIRPTTDEESLNKTERRFLAYLRAKPNSVTGIQNITLKIGDYCRYTPDFWHISDSQAFTFYEVKGGFWRDDARVKVKVAARSFRWANFIVAQRVKGGWRFEVIKP